MMSIFKEKLWLFLRFSGKELKQAEDSELIQSNSYFLGVFTPFFSLNYS
jgi:hypothetical protein